MSDIYHKFGVNFFTPNTFNNLTALLFFFLITIIFTVFITIMFANDSDSSESSVNIIAIIFATSLYIVTTTLSYVYGVEKDQSITKNQAITFIKEDQEKDCPILTVLAINKNYQTKITTLDLSNKVLFESKIIKQYWGKQLVKISYLENKSDKINEKTMVIITTNSEYNYLTDFIKGNLYETKTLKNRNISLYNYGMNGTHDFLKNIYWKPIQEDLID